MLHTVTEMLRIICGDVTYSHWRCYV